MKFTIESGKLFSAVQAASSVVERRQTLPILANFLLSVSDDRLVITGTDLELEVTLPVSILTSTGSMETTLPARRLLDVCRVSGDDTVLEFEVDAEAAVIKAGRARFNLAPLPAVEFPSIETGAEGNSMEIEQGKLKELIDRSAFAMAQQDVRYYLNGMLFEVTEDNLRLVATDGHRMAVVETRLESPCGQIAQIIPRKSVTELARLLRDNDDLAQLRLSSEHLVATIGEVSFKSKLIVANFPDYRQVIPTGLDKTVRVDRALFKDSLARVAVFSNEKFRLVKLRLEPGNLVMQTSNSEKESAEDELQVEYQGPGLEIGFNVNYLLDIVGAVSADTLAMQLGDVGSGCLIEAEAKGDCQYVIMPMRL